MVVYSFVYSGIVVYAFCWVWFIDFGIFFGMVLGNKGLEVWFLI